MFLTESDCNNFKISPNAAIKDAVQVLESGELKIVLVIEDEILKGTVYDGDIRRALLKGMDLSYKIRKAMVSNFISVSEEASINEIYEKMNKNSISHIPVIDKKINF